MGGGAITLHWNEIPQLYLLFYCLVWLKLLKKDQIGTREQFWVNLKQTLPERGEELLQNTFLGFQLEFYSSRNTFLSCFLSALREKTAVWCRSHQKCAASSFGVFSNVIPSLCRYHKLNAILDRWSICCRTSVGRVEVSIYNPDLLRGFKLAEKENTFRWSTNKNLLMSDCLIHQSSCQQAYTWGRFGLVRSRENLQLGEIRWRVYSN